MFGLLQFMSEIISGLYLVHYFGRMLLTAGIAAHTFYMPLFRQKFDCVCSTSTFFNPTNKKEFQKFKNLFCLL